MSTKVTIAFATVLLVCSGCLELSAQNVSSVVYAREIQPILANHCWSCHGPDEKGRQADLRLDMRDIAIARGAIVGGDVKSSKLVERMHSADPELQMPPPESKRPLTAKQIELIEHWIEQGAPFAKHWSFIPPQRPELPATSHDTWARNPIDRFVLKRLEADGLTGSKQADRATLLRRVTLDLTGLPPTLEEQQAFLQDRGADAYEKVVERLLGSQAYAERMAMNWLDLARYADTNGYNNDEDRTMWPWRDWVIRAFEENKPYDQFIVEQLAGDLLPNATRDQLIATAFLRNQGHNTEGGIIPEEYRVEYVADRVHTTATVFLGLSMQCARCHDHKYDPITQQEYYQFFALFNNLDEKQASYSKFVAAEPFIRVPTTEQEERLKGIDQKIAELQSQRLRLEENALERCQSWFSTQEIASVRKLFGLQLLSQFAFEKDHESQAYESLAQSPKGTVEGKAAVAEGKFGGALELDGAGHLNLGDIGNFDGASPFTISVWVYPASGETMAVLSKMDEQQDYRGFDLLIQNGKVASHLISKWPSDAILVTTKQAMTLNSWHHVTLRYDGSRKASGLQIYIDSKLEATDVSNDSLQGAVTTAKPFHLGLRETSLPYRGKIDELRIYEGAATESQVTELYQGNSPADFVEVLAKLPSQRTEAENQQVKTFFLSRVDAEYSQLGLAMEAQKKERVAVEDQVAAVMVMKEMQPPRETFVLKRGQYDQPSDRVATNVPAVLKSGESSVANRLDFARWLVDRSNPLTARVAVNRWWQNYFGVGLVKTAEDFGITGEVPSHPELLDFLAVELIESGWDVKAIQKLIVMSQTYQQESHVTPEMLERDPENRLLGRGPRFRLPAETVRDNALSVAGLLRHRVGGPSVKPYQPDGLWEDVTVERRGKYVPDQGEGLYRRSMYTFWKRTCPPPSMMNFDAPNREVCLARRARTNTPLQSLVLLNDPTFVEAARVLAEKMIASSSVSTVERINLGYRRCLSRDVRPDELEVMLGLLDESLQRFREDPKAASDLISHGSSPVESGLDPVEVAAWTVVASTLLNLDETISKR